ncbi:MAG TPA: ABC-2 family transporter protein [Verrucomicrobiae bacterium]
MTETIKRYWGIYVMLWRNSVVREMGFKSNFILWLIVELLWFALQLIFVGVLYMHTEHIGTWSKWEVVMLFGASHFIQQLFTAFFLVNLANVSELIRTGKLDFMMLLPVNTRFLISFKQVDLGGFISAATGIAVMIYACRKLGIMPEAAHIIGFLLLSIVGLIIHYSLMFLLTSVSFWTVRAQGIVWGYYNLFNISRQPDEAFKGLFKTFFTFVLPMMLVVNVPVRVLIQKLGSPGQLTLMLVMALLCWLASVAFWRFSVSRYTSASS